MFVEVHRAGLAAVTDLGRPGHGRAGIAPNGAADQYSATVANILVGNPETAPLIEITASALTVSFSGPALIAVTGAPAPLGGGHRSWEPVCLPARTPVTIPAAQGGLRTYLAVHGTLRAPRMLASCAPDPLLGFGIWLRAGSRVGLDTNYVPFDHPVFRHPLFRLGAPVPRFGSPWTIDVTDGPDTADFAGRILPGARYRVSPDSDHIGLRLRGPAPIRQRTGEPLSRGVPTGAVEVTPAGELLVLVRGHPVTAGYPVIAVTTRAAQPALGQAAPGHELRFRHRERAEAIAAYQARRQALDRLTTRVRTSFTELGISCPAAQRSIERSVGANRNRSTDSGNRG